MEGWISVHRQIQNHWIWKDKEPFDKRSAWIDLLLMVNHQTERIYFNGIITEVNRGERITSIEGLASRWKWSRHKVSDFLNALEQDKMIIQVRDKNKTLISIENYERFQKEVVPNWDTCKDTKRTPESIENTEQNEGAVLNRDTFRDIKRTCFGHKQ